MSRKTQYIYADEWETYNQEDWAKLYPGFKQGTRLELKQYGFIGASKTDRFFVASMPSHCLHTEYDPLDPSTHHKVQLPDGVLRVERDAEGLGAAKGSVIDSIEIPTFITRSEIIESVLDVNYIQTGGAI